MQRAIPLTTSITSIKLLSLQAKLAFDMFQEIAEKILEGQELPSQRQKYMGSIQYHYSWDRPNGGILDAAWDFRTISAFLRAMDYGRLFCWESRRLWQTAWDIRGKSTPLSRRRVIPALYLIGRTTYAQSQNEREALNCKD